MSVIATVLPDPANTGTARHDEGTRAMKTARIMNQLVWWSFSLIFVCMAMMFGIVEFGRVTGVDSVGPGSFMSIGFTISAMGLFIFAFLTLCLFVGGMIVGAVNNRMILARGEGAIATILKISETGTTINDSPVVRFLLRVTPQDRPPFQAEAERLVSRLEIPQFQPGRVVDVKFNPDTKAVAVC
jgi:hypothetical protein